MGYSNVAGDLNVYGTSTLSSLVVNGSTTHYGPITSSNSASFANLIASNLTVTGNFIISATNTSVSNSLRIVNQGTATALYVNQNEFPNMTYNVAEFWDHTQLAMVIDGYGNVAIHTAASPAYAFTVVDGASIDTLTLGTPLAISSGGTGTATGAGQNTVFAGPLLSSGAPSFRSLVSADLPSYISVSNVSANGAALSSLTGSNVTGNVAQATLALVVSQAAQPNITSVGTLTGLTVSGILTSGLYIGNASGLSNLNSSNLVGNVANSNVALVVSQAAQPNITSVGTLTGLTVSGLLIASNGSGISNLNSSNLVGNVANANVALVVSQAAQPNITSVGTLTGLAIQGLLIASNGSGISNLNSSNLVGNVANANVALVVSQAAQPNITSVGTLTGLTVSGLLVASNGSGISNLNSSNLVGNVANANVALVVSQAAQPNITSVGTLTGLAIQGLLVASNASGLSNLNASNVTLGTLSTGVFPTSGVTAGTYGSSANVSRVSVDTYGRVTAASNVAIVSSQWTTGTGNIYYLAHVGIGTSLVSSNLTVAGNAYISNAVTTTNVIASSYSGTTSGGTVIDTNGTVSLTAASSGVKDQFGNPVIDNYGTFWVNSGISLWPSASQIIDGVGTVYLASGSSGLQNQSIQQVIDNNGTVYLTNASSGLRNQSSQTIIDNTGLVNLVNGLQISGAAGTAGQVLQATGTGNGVQWGTDTNSQWTGTSGTPIYYVPQVGIGSTVTPTSNLQVTGNIYASTAITTRNVFANTLVLANASSYINVIGAVAATTFYGTLAGSNTGTFSNVSASNAAGLSTLNASNVVFGTLSTSVFPTSGVTAGTYGSSANVSQVSVDTYGRVTAASNVAITSSQWTTGTGNIYYLASVGIGTSVVSSNLTVSGNLYVSNSIQTGNLILGGVTSGGFLRAQGASNVTSVTTIPIGSGGTNQTSYGTVGGVVYYDGTQFQAASGIVASTATTLNVTTANITTLQTNSFIPSASGLFMNLNATYTLTPSSNWLGSIAGTITSNLYTLFAPLPGISGWSAYGSSSCVNQPTANGGIRFNQPGPYMITTVISADSGIKTIALSSNLGNTVDIHSNVTNVWQYCYRFPFGDVNPWPVTIPVNVTNTSQYYYIDFETNNQSDNIHQTAYTNTATQAYTGSYVIIRPV